MNPQNRQKKPKSSNTQWYFLSVVALTYLVLGFVNYDIVFNSLITSKNIFLKILPALGVIFAVMMLVNYFISQKTVKKYLGVSSGVKRWPIAIISGIISTGPIYVWYPLLNDLRKKGLGYGFIATFMYNRAVKIPLLPLLIYYFTPTFTGVLLGVMISLSVLQGLFFVQLEKAGVL